MYYFFFSPRIKVEAGIVTVSNIRSKTLSQDIKRIFKTTRINTYMFTDVRANSMSFPEFFALEMYHILDDLIAARKTWTQVRDLRNIQKELLEKTWLGQTEKEVPGRLDFSQLENMSLTPLDYQREFLNHYDIALTKYNLLGMLLAAGPGTGKTFTSLATAECLHAERIVVVCPKNAIDQVWHKSAIGDEKGHKCVYKKPQKTWVYAHGQPYRDERILIFHYEAIEKAFELVSRIKNNKVVVILDESHNLNELSSLRTDRFIRLCQELESTDIIEATGTPIKALSVEAIPLLRAIDPLFTPDVEQRFKKMFAGEANATTTILSRRLNIVSFKVNKSRTNLEKPEEETIKVQIPNGDQFTLEAIGIEMKRYIEDRIEYYAQLRPSAVVFCNRVLDRLQGHIDRTVRDPSQRAKAIQDLYDYRAMVDQVWKAASTGDLRSVLPEMVFCNKYEKTVILPFLEDKKERDTFKDYKSIVKYPILKIRGECLGRVLGRRRIDAHLAMIPHIDFDSIIQSSEKKTVVFSSFVEVLESIIKRLKAEGYAPLGVYGQFVSELNGIVQKFEKDENANPLVASYAALSTAVPLTMADTMLLVNMPFRDYILEQTIARIHRLGADTQVRIFNTVLDTGNKVNISTRNTDILKWSREQVNAIIGVSEDDVASSGEDDIGEVAVKFAFEDLLDRKEIVKFSSAPSYLSW